MTSSIKKITGIILAAGTGSRMGKTKQLLPFGDTTILGRVVSHAQASNLEKIIIVLGHDAKKIQQHLDDHVDLTHTRIIMNNNYKKGQSTSLVKGVTHLSQNTDGAMFLLADQPLVTSAIINHLIEAFNLSDKMIVIPFHKTQRGNPVIISKTLFPQLTALTADTGARALFKKYNQYILKVPMDDSAVLNDVDTTRDYKKLIS